MPQDKNQNNPSTNPSSLIGKRFGGFRNDMNRMGNDSSDASSTDSLNKSVTNNSAQASSDDQDEYKKIIDTRSIEEIEADTQRLEKIVASTQVLEPEKELEAQEQIEGPEEEPEIETPEPQKKLETSEKELEIEAPEPHKELSAPKEEPKIETPKQKIGLETSPALKIKLPSTDTQEELEERTEEIHESNKEIKSEIRNQKSEIDDQRNKSGTTSKETKEDKHEYNVTTMPPKSKFKFNKIEWYWHIVKRPSLGLALLVVIIYTFKVFSTLPAFVLFILDVVNILFTIYIFFLISWRVVKFRQADRSQAIVAGFVAGCVAGLVTAFFKIIYIWQIWTVINLIVEAIILGVLGGLLSGLGSLVFKKRNKL